MANTIKIKRSAVAGKTPAVGDLQLGELAINTYDGRLFTKKDNGTASVVEIGGGASGPVLQYDSSLAENVTLTTGYNGLAESDFAIESGYTLEVPSGQVFTVGSFDLKTTGVAAGTYDKVTVDTYGRVTAGNNVASATSVSTALLSTTGATTIYKTDVGSGNYFFDKYSNTWTAPSTGTILIQAYPVDSFANANGWATGILYLQLKWNSVELATIDTGWDITKINGVTLPPLMATVAVTANTTYTLGITFFFQNFTAPSNANPVFNFFGNSSSTARRVVFTYV